MKIEFGNIADLEAIKEELKLNDSSYMPLFTFLSAGITYLAGTNFTADSSIIKEVVVLSKICYPFAKLLLTSRYTTLEEINLLIAGNHKEIKLLHLNILLSLPYAQVP